jgi:hypothetical protein
MVKKKTTYEVDPVCMTNLSPDLFRKDIRVIPLRHGLPAWWSKIEMFDSRLETEDRIVCFDIDLLVVGNIDEIIEHPADFALYDYWSLSTFKKAGYTARGAVKRAQRLKGKRLLPIYSSDVIVMDRGARSQIYENFKPQIMEMYCGDQDWIAAHLGRNEAKFPGGWTRKMRKGDRKLIPGHDFKDLKTIACHPIKNHQLRAKGFEYFANLWEGESQ